MNETKAAVTLALDTTKEEVKREGEKEVQDVDISKLDKHNRQLDGLTPWWRLMWATAMASHWRQPSGAAAPVFRL